VNLVTIHGYGIGGQKDSSNLC